ncbi:MAG: hypothetical protein J7K61_06525 [Thermoplasmata archaeon]|nr:hypothetical protein [Thermoplasmata archaeon]
MKEMVEQRRNKVIRQNYYGSGEGTFLMARDGTLLQASNLAFKVLDEIIDEVRSQLRREKTTLRWRNYEINIYPLLDEGEITKYFGIVRDNSEMEMMEQYVNIAYETITKFRRNVSHYFFNPIIIAKGYIELLMEGDIGADEKKKLEKARTAIERIEAVVKNTVMHGVIKE